MIYDSIAVVIPALNPDNKLYELIEKLKNLEGGGFFEKIIVINDGSFHGMKIFDQIQKDYSCIVIDHYVNLGKGRALKTAINYCATKMQSITAVITVDSDGQHQVEDIVRCAKRHLEYSEAMVLGCRDFGGAGIPFRSRFGNEVTKKVFSFLCGVKISDTQTGLRVIPRDMFCFLLSIKGERYEFETAMLIEAKERNFEIVEEKIKTIYIDENKSSHFNPLLDSIKIYLLFFKYMLSSMGVSLLDFLVFSIAIKNGCNLIIAMIVARTVAVIFNFTINDNYVFKSKCKGIKKVKTILKYLFFVAFSGIFTYFGIKILNSCLAISIIISKIFLEASIFFFNFYVQHTFVFSKKQ